MTPRRPNLIAASLRREGGSSTVELAISATLLFSMLFGICQMSIALYAYHFTSDAARQATRWAMVRGSTCHANTPSLSTCAASTGASADQIQTYVRTLNFPGIRTANVTATTTWCAASSSTPTTWSSCSSTTAHSPGNLVKVTVSYPLTFTIPFARSLSLNMSATSGMVISQ